MPKPPPTRGGAWDFFGIWDLEVMFAFLVLGAYRRVLPVRWYACGTLPENKETSITTGLARFQTRARGRRDRKSQVAK